MGLMFMVVFEYIFFIHLGPAVYFHGNSNNFNRALGIVWFPFSVFMHRAFLFNVLFAFVHKLNEVHLRKSYRTVQRIFFCEHVS